MLFPLETILIYIHPFNFLLLQGLKRQPGKVFALLANDERSDVGNGDADDKSDSAQEERMELEPEDITVEYLAAEADEVVRRKS